jgi:hypothetical protein
MSEIRTKLLSLSVLAVACAGLSYGQTITCVYNPPAPYNPTIRAEGQTELVSDASAACASTIGAASLGSSVTATLSAAVTSKAVSTTATYAGNSDAVLQVIQGAVTTTYPGTVSGNGISFSGVSLPNGAFTLQVSNVRVNASTASNPQIGETLQVIYNNNIGQGLVAPITGTVPPVGYATASLSVAIAQNASNQNIYYGVTASNFATCNGEPLSTSSTAPADTIAYTLNISELVAGAFKVMAGTGVYSPSSEAGSYQLPVSGVNTIGQATSATQLNVNFTNIPSAATIYLPISVSVGGTTLSLLGNNVALTTPNALAVINPGVVAFTPSGGVVTATYAVTAVPGAGSLKGIFPLNVYMNVAANAAPVQTTAMTVAVTYVPVATVSGPAASVPTFAASTVTPLNTLTVTPCQTTLIFPFVTNSTGFETGIAIANTTTDNLAKNGTASSATPTAGTCVINVYDSAATLPTAFTTPTIGVGAPVYANTLTSMFGGNVSGYAIALCNFLDAHAFAYIVAAS